MLLNISNIGLTDWLFAFLALTGIFGIPSIIAMYKIGLKAYRQQLRILRLMNRKISTGYKIIHNQVYTYSGSGYSGTSTVTREEINHFFPIVVDKNHL